MPVFSAARRSILAKVRAKQSYTARASSPSWAFPTRERAAVSTPEKEQRRSFTLAGSLILVPLASPSQPFQARTCGKGQVQGHAQPIHQLARVQIRRSA